MPSRAHLAGARRATTTFDPPTLMPRSRPNPPNPSVELAAEHLTRVGYEILDKPVKKRSPIDLVARREHLLVFITVRRLPDTSARADYATERQAVNVREASARWITEHSPITPAVSQLRFDAIAITLDNAGRLLRLDHIEGLY